MILLVSFIICVLIFFIIHKSNKNRIVENPKIAETNFREKYFWKDENKAYSLLLHSININDSSFSAYSIKWDSIMIFQALPSELQSIKNKLQDYTIDKQKCSNCHVN